MIASSSNVLASSRGRWLVLALLTAVEFIVFLDIAIVNVALPSIKAGLGLSEAELAWVVNAYQLVFGGFLILGGRAADLLGRARMFVAGLLAFVGGSLLAGLATGATSLIVARALQGLGAALVVPAGQSLIVTIFAERDEFNRAFGVWSAMKAAGAASGVAFGGILTQFWGWPSTFLINVPIGAIVLFLAPSLIPRDEGSIGWAKLDWPGALTATAALLLLVYGLEQIPTSGWGSAQSAGAIVLALLLLTAFLAIEARARLPLVPLRLFGIRDLNGANLTSLLLGASHVPMFYFLSRYLQEVMAYDAFQAGAALLPIALINIAVSSGLISKVLGRFGYRAVLIGGMLALALGLALFARAPVTGGYWLDVLPASLIVAFGLRAAFVGVAIPAVKAVNEADSGLASGLVNTVQRVGSGLGVAVLTSLAMARTGSPQAPSDVASLADGFQVAFLGASLFAALGAVVAMTIIQGPKQEVPDDTTDGRTLERDGAC